MEDLYLSICICTVQYLFVQTYIDWNGGLKYAGFHSTHLNEFDLFPPKKNRKHDGFSRKEGRKEGRT